jgi:hypothetical protein
MVAPCTNVMWLDLVHGPAGGVASREGNHEQAGDALGGQWAGRGGGATGAQTHHLALQDGAIGHRTPGAVTVYRHLSNIFVAAPRLIVR